MLFEKLNSLTLADIYEIYPDIYRHKNIILHPENEYNVIITMYKSNLRYIIDIILGQKFPQSLFKSGHYKEKPFRYNDYSYLIDCNLFHGQELTDFIQEYSSLFSVSLKPNIYIFLNVNQLDIDQQSIISSCMERNYRSSRFWFCCENLNRLNTKLRAHTFSTIIRRPTDEIMKQQILKYTTTPIFEIILDKIIEKSKGDIGSAFLLYDIFKYDPEVLNRDYFETEYMKIKQFMTEPDYVSKNFHELREICYRLCEKADIIDIVYYFINVFVRDYPVIQISHTIIDSIAKHIVHNRLVARQVHILETWFLECIIILREINTIPKA